MASSQKVSIILPPVWYVYNVNMICGSTGRKFTAPGIGFAGVTNNAAALAIGIYFTEMNIFKLQAKKIMQVLIHIINKIKN